MGEKNPFKISHLSLLLIEDETVCQHMYRLFLTSQGHKLDYASRGCETLERLNEKKYDIIITELGLPDISGIEIIYATRHYSLNHQTPIIVLSSHIDHSLKQMCFEHGANQVLMKPISLNHLKKIIEETAVLSKNDRPSQLKRASPFC